MLPHPACRMESSPGVLKFVSPQYPHAARLYHLTGLVNVEVKVGTDGKVLSAKGSGSAPVLVKAAERNVTQWQFGIPKKGPYPVVRTVVYEFKLQGKPSSVGLTTAEFRSPDRVIVVDQPAFESVPDFSKKIIDDDLNDPEPRLLQMFRDCYAKHCATQATGPVDQVSLRELIDCYSKHCEQKPKDGH
jgi:TonB family protein